MFFFGADAEMLGTANVAIRCGTRVIVPGINVHIWTDKVIDARAHGRALKGTDLKRSESNVATLHRQIPGDADWTPVQDVDADTFGHWTSDSLEEVYEYTGSVPKTISRWVYGIGTAPSTIGPGYSREYITGDADWTEKRFPDLGQLYMGAGQQYIAWKSDGDVVQTQKSYRGGYLWSPATAVGSGTMPAVLKDHDGGLYVAIQRNAASTVVMHKSRDDGRTWGSLAKSFGGQFPELWRGANNLQYLSIYSGGTHVIRRGYRGMSTVAGSGSITAGGAARAAIMQKPHGEILVGIPSGASIQLYASRDFGATYSHQVRNLVGTQVDLVLGREGIEYAAVLSGTRQRFFRGAGNFSTLLTWPSQLSLGGTTVQGSGIIASGVDDERPAGLRLVNRGNYLIAAVTVSGTVQVHASHKGGLQWGRIA